MIITCPECATEFKTPDNVFANGPRKLRCMKCAHVWSHDPANDQTSLTEQSDDFMTADAEMAAVEETAQGAEPEMAGGEVEDPFDFDSLGDDETDGAGAGGDFDSLSAVEPDDKNPSDDEASDALDDALSEDAAASGDEAEGEAEKPEIHPLEFLDDETDEKKAQKADADEKDDEGEDGSTAKGGSSVLRKWAPPKSAPRKSEFARLRPDKSLPARS